MRTHPAMSPGLSTRVTEAMIVSPLPFHKRYRSSYKTPLLSSSPTLPIRKRYQGTSELVEDTEDESSDSDTKGEGLEDESLGLEDEGLGSEEEEKEAAPKGQQQAILVVDTAANELWVLVIMQEQRVKETLTPRPPTRTTWVDHVDGTVYTDISIYVPPVYAPVQTPPSPEWSSAAAIAVDEDEFLEARYDDHRLIHDLLVQHTMMQHDLQEMRDCVSTLK
uniref:Uncharacterized protein n=1 Tax=Tanacetum cinerariifolium TaxID=118510 RepID=A0A6L2KRS7_TANCI|nr:hypothetical protein [Tanacetum cinerariifolium]